MLYISLKISQKKEEKEKHRNNKIKFFFTKETRKSLNFTPLKYRAKTKITKQYLIFNSKL